MIEVKAMVDVWVDAMSGAVAWLAAAITAVSLPEHACYTNRQASDPGQQAW